MEKHLYIIGNGFDRHHGIPSNYYDKGGGPCFRKWLDENEYEILCEIDDNFGRTDELWWTKFEESLASVETLRVAYEEAFECYPNFGSDVFHDRDWYDAELSVENRLNIVYFDIVSAFRKWINQLPLGNPMKKIRIEKSDSIFLSFNYTDTLESLYEVPSSNILYIHGKANSDDELILGHGLTYQDLQRVLEQYETVESGDYVYQRAKDAALNSVSSHRKKTEAIIRENKEWFNGLFDVTNIHIYGHSLNCIDMPYYRMLFEMIDRKKIMIEMSCFKEEDCENAKKLMNVEGFSRSQYKLIELKDIQIV